MIYACHLCGETVHSACLSGSYRLCLACFRERRQLAKKGNQIPDDQLLPRPAIVRVIDGVEYEVNWDGA